MATVTTDKSWLGGEIQVEGLDEVLNALDKAAPDIRRRIARDLKRIGETVAEASRRRYGSDGGDRSRWSILSDEQSSMAANGITVTRRYGGVQIKQNTGPGSIIEFARTPHSPQGEAMVRALEREYGPPGRVMWASWDELQAWALDQIRDLVAQAEAALQASVDGAGPA